VKPLCPVTGKEKHDTRQDAEASGKPGQRVFRCGCGSWHLAVGSKVGTAVSARV